MEKEGLHRAAKLSAVALIVIISFFHLTRDIRDLDFFWHLKTGQWIVQHRALPAEDLFSYPAEGRHSVRERFILTSYWLSQAVFYLFYLAAQIRGIVFMRFILAGFLIYVMIKRREGESLLYLSLLLLFVSLFLKSYPVERPQVFSFLFFAVLLFLLRRLKDKKTFSQRKFRRLCEYAVLPLLMVVWANMHGGYAAGVATLLLYAVFESLKFLHPALCPQDKEVYRRLLVVCIAGILVSFANPNTYHVFAQDILFQSSSMTAYNIEFLSTMRIFAVFRDYSILVYWFVLFLAAAGFIINIRNADITDMALAAGTGFFSFFSVRYVAFFMIAALPATARNLSGRRMTTALGMSLFVLSMATGIFFTWNYFTFRNFSTGQWISGSAYPVDAADFIANSDLKGNMYNYYNWGGYLIWRLSPERKVFIDGRNLYADIYEESKSIDNAKGEFEGTQFWKAAFSAYNISYAIVPLSVPLSYAIFEDPGWVPIFFNLQSVVYVRNVPLNYSTLMKYSIPKRYMLNAIRQYAKHEPEDRR